MGTTTEPLPAPLERPSRTPAILTALLAAGLLAYGLSNSYTFLGHNLLLPRDAYIPGGIGIVLLLWPSGCGSGRRDAAVADPAS